MSGEAGRAVYLVLKKCIEKKGDRYARKKRLWESKVTVGIQTGKCGNFSMRDWALSLEYKIILCLLLSANFKPSSWFPQMIFWSKGALECCFHKP